MRFPSHQSSRNSDFLLHKDAFSLPYPGLDWLPVPSLEVHRMMEVVMMVLCIFFIIGLLTRIVAPLLALMFSYHFLLSQWFFLHHTFLIVIVLYILAFSSCADHYSLDAYLSSKNRCKRTILSIRMIQVLIAFLYLFTAICKLNDGWFTGQIMKVLHRDHTLEGIFTPYILQIFSYRFLGVGTVLAEGFLAIALWIPPWRRFAILVGILLHLGIDMMMNVGPFSYQMMVLYIAFIHTSSGKTTVLYDGKCHLCQRAVRWGRFLDWLRRITWQDSRETSEFSQQNPEREMAVIAEDGEVLTGQRGLRYLCGRFPITFMLSFALFLPILGKLLYVVLRRILPFMCTQHSDKGQERSEPDAASTRISFHWHLLIIVFALLQVSLMLRAKIFEDDRYQWSGVTQFICIEKVEYVWVKQDGSQVAYRPGRELRAKAARIAGYRQRNVWRGIGTVRVWITGYLKYLYDRHHRESPGCKAFHATIHYRINSTGAVLKEQFTYPEKPL